MFKKNLSYKNPNKYLIKNKKFIRDFKRLYFKIPDPWNQKKNFNIDETTLILEGYLNYFNSKFKKIKILDVGAGSGILKTKLNKKFIYIGTDIHFKKYRDVIFDDIIIFNKNFENRFNIIFCLKTIYYVADNINKVVSNFQKYLKKDGILIVSYNLKKNSFSNKYLNDLKLRKMLKKKFKEISTIEVNRENYEKFNKEKNTILIFKKK
tara:strand:- start:11 stop:634 length:624 start_codon:yes stop_codon:yes gene_type:complete